jgi:hypothetical protein
VLIAIPRPKMPHLLGKAPALGHQHASKRDERVFLRVIETLVQGLGRLDHLVQICPALRVALRLRIQAVHRRQVIALLLLQGDHARFGAVLDRRFKRAPKLFLIGVQPKTGLHAFELGVESRLRPTLHEFNVGGLLIALCGGGSDGETGSGEGGCRRCGGSEPMSTILTYNPVLIDERNEKPFLIAFVATVAVWAVTLLIVVV